MSEIPDPMQAASTADPPAGSVRGGPRASFGRRLGAYLIDAVVLVALYIILVGILKEAGVLVFVAVALAYQIYLEGGHSGQTVGKKAVGIRVVDLKTGGSIGYGRAVLRMIGKWISGLPLYLGYLWMLWDPEKQTWHDKIATTAVVPVAEYPVSRWP
ncbi:MAG: RDD family protein [Gaiella sp.]